jgi:hypothetical protein
VRILRTGLLLILVAVTGLLAGCGSSHSTAGSQRSRTTPAGTSKDAAAVSVIEGWARALRRGDVRAAARYFAVPSVFVNGQAFVIRSQHEARALNESLTCGALVTSTTDHGKYITAAFRLTNRAGPGADCGSGAGQPAATDFVIKDGHIVDWIRAPAGGAAPKVPKLPATTATPGQPV